ncbi:hypothetical protein C8A01DRAFT_42464 [Parachaetomium inaequale]|uniref:Ubiquitin-like domain-containing protein n=1 Tax=Parachaetomium inaequale TaxID=2588326 RepID=A0AAN6SWI2_9PEZI|nr:hypothetical protein C8A01DRAFT_42464 [Parachaetomium inaequale]
MTDDRPSSAPPGPQDDAPVVVNLQIVSPSAGVGSLRFPDTPAATTVQQLREKIRESLASRPADDQQRLIHRGRLLARDTDTLQDVFGEEAQTIHLVLRDTGEAPPPGDPLPHHIPHALRNPPNAAIPRPGSAPIGMPHVAAHFPQHPQHPQHPQLHQHQVQQQELLQRMTQLHQREANYRHLLAQQQNHRVAMGPHAQDGNNNAQVVGDDPTGGRNSPVGQAFRTVTREGTGPDGQRYSFRITVNELIAPVGASRPPVGPGPTSDPVGQRPLSAADVRNIIHGADATRAAQTMANAMQRNASGAHPANMAAELAHFNFNSPIQPIQPGVTTPIFPGVSRNASRAATPDTSARSVSRGSGFGPSSVQPPGQPQGAQWLPEVYILSSPTGPRGLLINNGSEMYTTPAARALPLMPNFYRPLVPTSLVAETHRPEIQIQGPGHVTITRRGEAPVHIQATPTQPYRPHSPLAQQPYQPPPPLAQQQPLPQAHNAQQPAIRRRPVAGQAAPAAAPAAQPAPQLNPHGNPGVAPLVAAAWPHIWLIARLVAFAWWFSYTDPSWERWLSLVLAFVVVVAINTGLFNGMVNNAFHPVREQLEGMIPFADPNRQQQQQQQQQQNVPEGAGDQHDENGANPDPAQTAQRLVAQRRVQNGNWLRDHMRRIERAGILFLASFAPGVAERHIQQLEEQERAERRAAEGARAAAAEAAAAAAAAQEEAERAAAEGQGGQEGQDGQDGEEAVQQQPRAPEVQPQPLLADW